VSEKSIAMVEKLANENVRLKRAYEPASRADGKRVLVDRLWPRGVKKTEAKIDAWMKEIAPSAELRKWFAHDPHRWAEFRRRYKEELKEHTDEIARLRTIAEDGRLTLVFAARDEAHNDAVVLRELILRLKSGH
jgi:uncharacterized protein YeaO (DUF488 family)